MKGNSGLLKGILFVGIGAASYGILATLVRFAYNDGYTTAEFTISQYLLGLMSMGLLVLTNRRAKAALSFTTKDKHVYLKLMVGGSFYGFTGLFYYLSVKFIPVSISVIFLMQAIWMGIILESILAKKIPSIEKCFAVILILLGTVLATNAIENMDNLNVQGIFWGVMAAITYSITLLVANKIAPGMHAQQRSFWILLGATLVVVVLGCINLPEKFNISIFWKWGLLLALFGTILPPVLFNMGMPKTGIGLGSIIVSIEIPVSVSMAFMLLDEEVLIKQWLGIGLIIISIVAINFKTLMKEFKSADHQTIQITN